MAEQRAVWGIDIGHAGLKAIKLRYAEASNQAVAVAFDYIPHPKILSQPDAIPEELIPQALETFLSRNEFDGDLISIGVPGKSSLARFVQLPPVEASKVAEIVKFEAKQQIPFPLEEVIWDWQPLGNPDEASGFMIDAEVGLFAMKRTEVENALRPFTAQKVEVELIQTGPVALYNTLVYDEMGIRPGSDEVGGSDYYIVLDMGCDDTTLIISNGEKIWIRTVNIGGNNFTRALVKEMKLSFAKAEHLKCNATKAPDPRSVFQALRPVFNDYVAEIKRSIGFFTGVNRQAKISKVFGVGNGFKLAGLQKYLAQNLEYEVVRPETFKGLAGDSVLNSPLFQENMLSFPVAYGLALQTLGQAQLNTTLLPPEIAFSRKVRRKKPWAVAAAATLMFGFSTAMGVAGMKYDTIKDGEEGKYKDAEAAAAALTAEVGKLDSAYKAEQGRYESAKGALNELVEGRRDLSWIELYDTINAALPRDPRGQEIEDISLRRAINVQAITFTPMTDVAEWFTPLTEEQTELMSPRYRETGPTGEGYIVTIDGKSWHNDPNVFELQKYDYVYTTLVRALSEWQIQQDGKRYDVARMGITHPVITYKDVQTDIPVDSKGNVTPKRTSRFQRGPATPPPVNPQAPPTEPGQTITETRFRVEFAWVPVPPAERLEADPNAEAAAEADAAAAAEDAAEAAAASDAAAATEQ